MDEAASASVEGALKSRIGRIKPDAHARIRRGFSILHKLNNDTQTRIVEQVVNDFVARSDRPISDFAKIADVSDPEASELFIAVASSVGVLMDIDADADIYLRAASDLYTPESAGAVRGLTNYVMDRRLQLKKAFEASKLASTVLPSFMALELEVDVRFKFEGDDIDRSAPVAIAYIETDADSQHIWMQLTESDTASLAEKFKEASERLKALRERFCEKSA